MSDRPTFFGELYGTLQVMLAVAVIAFIIGCAGVAALLPFWIFVKLAGAAQ